MHKKQLVLSAAIVASGIAFLDGSAVTLALPKIAADMHLQLAGMQWVMDGF